MCSNIGIINKGNVLEDWITIREAITMWNVDHAYLKYIELDYDL